MDTDEQDPADRPPFFKTWRGMYALLLGTLAALIVLFSVMSWLYR